MQVYIAEVRCDAAVERKLRQKHGITLAHVREAVQWPARPRSKWDRHPDHGERLICVGISDEREVFAVLLPVPGWDPASSVWVVKTARWL